MKTVCQRSDQPAAAAPMVWALRWLLAWVDNSFLCIQKPILEGKITALGQENLNAYLQQQFLEHLSKQMKGEVTG